MDRLEGSASLMLVSDLDFTMVDHDDLENCSLLRFNALWESYYRENSLLVYCTGRSPAIYEHLINEKPLLTPDITILSVGTEIMYGETMTRDDVWEQLLDQKWDREVVTEETAKFPELMPQSETEQRSHKVSFFLEQSNAQQVIKALTDCLEQRGLDVKLIYSNRTALDILPKGAGKGQALAYLHEKFKMEGKLPINTLVCGDSGNDVELFGVPEVYGVMVSNALEELLQWYAENAMQNHKILHATERCVAGILQGIGKFGLGPNVSPRDIKKFQTCKLESNNPCHEVVKFYILYERWRRAEVEKSEEHVKHLKSTFFLAGTYVHPSGVEQSFEKSMDAMVRLYGDKKGKQYRIWLDRVCSAQIGPDTWLVKFYKWESVDDLSSGRRCCLTTVLLNSKAAETSFIWLHMHQTWCHESESKSYTDYLL